MDTYGGIPAWVWSCIFLVIIFSLNSLSVRVYGESEYWFALIKVVTVIIFIIIGLLTILGIMGGEFVGFETFTKGDGPILGGNLGGSLLSILGVFLVLWILIPRYRVNWYYSWRI